jgi:hypothetical protein
MLKSLMGGFTVIMVVLCLGCPADGASVIGPAGGFVFYDKGDYNGGWRYLEAAPEDAGTAAWGAANGRDAGIVVAGTGTAIGTGFHNTSLILAKLQELGETGKAAQLCDQYSYGGYDDWYLPSKDELGQMYESFKSFFEYDIYYWSSSVAGYSDNFYHTIYYNIPYYGSTETTGYTTSYYQTTSASSCKVRPIRRF